MNRSTPMLLAAVAALTACVDAPMSPEAVQSPTGFVRNEAPADGYSETGRHLVVFTSSSKIPGNFATRIRQLGGTIEASYAKIGVAVVSGLSSDAAAELEAADDVEAVDPDLEVQMVDPAGIEVEDADGGLLTHSPSQAARFARQWHLRAIGADSAWKRGFLGSAGVTVAILDTGLDYTHPDLAGRVDLARSRSFVPSDDAFLAANFPAGTHKVADMHFHGTHVGATVASNAVAAAGVTHNVTLMGVKVLNRLGSGSTSAILAGIMYAADAGADVINMSLGVRIPIVKANFPGITSVYNRAANYAHKQGVVVVVSAGNENQDMDTFGDELYKPYCTLPQVVCVSATGPTSGGTVGPWVNVDNKASYSNYGVNFVTVAAPGGASGGSVWAACSRFTTQAGLLVCRTGTFIVGSNGTSMAAPHVSGLAALLVERVGKDQPATVRARIHQSADDLGVEGADPIYGKGRINIVRALGL